MDKIVIVGFGGHGRSVADTIKRSRKFEIAGYTELKKYNDVSYDYLGHDDVLEDLFYQGVHNAVLGMGFMGEADVRKRLFSKMKGIGYEFPVICDPSAIISSDAVIGEGSFVGKNVVINAEAKIGKNCIINTSSIIEHECVVESETHIAVGAVVCGKAHIGNSVMIGAGSTIIQCVNVGDGTVIGAGSVVIHDVSCNELVVGIPGRVIRKND